MTMPDLSRYHHFDKFSMVVDKQSGRCLSSAAFARLYFTKQPQMALDAAFESHKEEPPMQSRVARLARDQAAISRPDLPGQPKTMIDDQDPTSGSASLPSGEECVQFVKLCMQGLEGDELQTFLGGLNDLLSTGAGAPMCAGDDAPNNNKSATTTNATDRRRAGARDKRPAQDATVRGLNHQSFMKRFPVVSKVDVWR